MQNSSQEFIIKAQYFGTNGRLYRLQKVQLLSKCYATILILAVINRLRKAYLLRKFTAKKFIEHENQYINYASGTCIAPIFWT